MRYQLKKILHLYLLVFKESRYVVSKRNGA